MITYFDDAPNIKAKAAVEQVIDAAYIEVRKLLPELSADLQIWLDNRHLIPETGEGGYSYAPDIINIAFDLDFKDRHAQLKNLRATIFHESFHVVQGHTYEQPRALYETALDSAIYEGCATIFEREYAHSDPLWGKYRQHDDNELQRWQEGLRTVSADEYYKDMDMYEKWAFYDKDTGERCRVYKTGTWLVDKVLEKTKLNILDLRTKSAADIIDLL